MDKIQRKRTIVSCNYPPEDHSVIWLQPIENRTYHYVNGEWTRINDETWNITANDNKLTFVHPNVTTDDTVIEYEPVYSLLAGKPSIMENCNAQYYNNPQNLHCVADTNIYLVKSTLNQDNVLNVTFNEDNEDSTCLLFISNTNNIGITFILDEETSLADELPAGKLTLYVLKVVNGSKHVYQIMQLSNTGGIKEL